MEWPTPSSAVFYGALSVHLGTFLLLRVSPILQASLLLRILVVVLGLLSALVGALSSRVQSDVKNALAFAALTQVGIITVEIGLGLRYVALVHMIGHACLRPLQLLRAPSVLKDRQMMEDAIGTHLSRTSLRSTLGPSNRHVQLYRFALERGYLDAILDRFVVRPFLALFRVFDSWERRWTDFLSGTTFRESDAVAPCGETFEESL